MDQSKELEIRPTENIGYLALLRSLFKHYPSRAIYGGTLMITQSFLYNAIFFTYGADARPSSGALTAARYLTG